MMFGFFINLSGIFSIFTAPFGAAGSAASGLAAARAQQRAMEAARRTNMLRTVDGPPHIPRVKRK